MRVCVRIAQIVVVALMLSTNIAASHPSEPRPSLVQAVAPAYPPIAATANAAGTVTIEVKIKSDGMVSSARAVNGVGVLAVAATNSARRWIFAATQAKAGVRTVRLTFVFRIMPFSTPKDELLAIFKPPYEVEVRAIVPEGIDSINRDPATE
jgi:TonB family protein